MKLFGILAIMFALLLAACQWRSRLAALALDCWSLVGFHH